MPTLKEQLTSVLPTLLSPDPQKAINGTELYHRVRGLLHGEYAEASIRQHFSVMAGDGTSPIAKVPKGQGYYRRSVSAEDKNSGTADEAAAGKSGPPRGEQPEEKFRALFARYAELDNRFPVRIEHTAAIKQQAGLNRWKFPDVIILDWEVGELLDDGYRIDPDMLQIRQSLGEQPFRLSSIELKVALDLTNFRQHFFQCVSNSKWAHNAVLVVATDLQDEKLTNELRRLGSSFDVSVSTFGLPDDFLGSLPNAETILNMKLEEFESIADTISITNVATGRARDTLDWEHIADLREQGRDFEATFSWVSSCLKDKRPYPFKVFLENIAKYK